MKKQSVKESEAVAKAIVALIHMPGVPDFLVDGMISLLHELQAATGAKLWNGEAKDIWNVEALARVVEHHQTMHLMLERKKDLAELISAVLNQPELPVQLYNELFKGVMYYYDELTAEERRLVDNSPERIRLILKAEECAG
jgi:hypothetical protein